MHILYVLCIGRVLGMQLICIELIGLYVRMFILSVNEHYSHYFIVIACLDKPLFSSHSILLDHIVLVSYAITIFSTYNDDTVLLCFRRFLFIWFKSLSNSRVYQILELGVSEFCSIIPNSHIKSRVCFRVLSGNS